jgi:hypothetical protein
MISRVLGRLGRRVGHGTRTPNVVRAGALPRLSAVDAQGPLPTMNSIWGREREPATYSPRHAALSRAQRPLAFLASSACRSASVASLASFASALA